MGVDDELGVTGTGGWGVLNNDPESEMRGLAIVCKRLEGVCTSTTIFLFCGVIVPAFEDVPERRANGSGLSLFAALTGEGVTVLAGTVFTGGG